MKTSRILIFEERPSPGRQLRFNLLDHAVEFDFRDPAKENLETLDLSRYAAIVAPVECARTGMIGVLSDANRYGGPMFLYRGEPPVHAVARWIIWGSPSHGGPEDPMADRLLEESLEHYSMASMYQQCLEMMSTQDGEKLLAQVTETFVNTLGGASCVIWLVSPSDPDEMLIASVRGAVGIDQEGSRFFLSRSETAEEIWKGDPFLVATGGGDGVRSGSNLFVPLLHQGNPIGLVKLGERSDSQSFGEREIHMARIIADHAAGALNTVDRLGRIEKVSLRDPETGAYSAVFLADYFEKERYKACRFHRPLSVVFLVVENYAFLVEQTRESIVVGALTSMVNTIRRAVRDSDLVAREEGNRFCIVLPETDSFGALLAVRRLRRAIKEKCRIQFLGTEFFLQPFFMSATCPRDGREFPDLLRVAEEKFARQQKSPLHRMRLADRPFWDAFETLVGKREHYDLFRKGEDVPYFLRFRKDLGRNAHFSVPRETWLRILEAVAQDVAANPEERGLVIAAGPTPEIYKQIFLSFKPSATPRRNVYVVGQSGSTRFDSKNLMYVAAEDELLKDREFVLYLKEGGAYGCFCAARESEVEGFNTADESLVEAMVEKAQEMYQLQGNF
ncbi:MAG: response receiver-modulated diguanylate cyclase [Deltaproteobacteria bacterium]|nr:response receiver-modulated diguanylate cyclase [Deltaproteobacteria bacterium]